MIEWYDTMKKLVAEAIINLLCALLFAVTVMALLWWNDPLLAFAVGALFGLGALWAFYNDCAQD